MSEKNYVTAAELEWARKRAKARAWFEDKKTKAETFCREHPAEAITIGCAIAGVAGKGIKFATKCVEANSEDRYRNRSIYDRRSGQYYQTRRDLTNRERMELARRYNNGELTGDILYDMGLL